MLQHYWDRVRGWCQDTVRASAIHRLSESVEGKILRKALPAVLTYLLVAAVLTGQLMLQTWPESFAAFLLGSPLISTIMLSLLALAARPEAACSVPLYASAGFAVLTAIQCILGAFALCLPCPPNRLVFALLTSIAVLVLCFCLSTSFVKESVRTMAKGKAAVQQRVEETVPDEDSDEADTE